MRNFEPNKGDRVSANEIIEMYSNKGSTGEDQPTLSRTSLGRIIQDLWGGNVQMSKIGKRGEKRLKYYVNVRKRLPGSVTLIQQKDVSTCMINDLHELEIPTNWTKIKNCQTSLSFLRAENWAFNGQRMLTELKITKEDSAFVITISCQGISFDIMDTDFGRELAGLEVDVRLQLLIQFLDNSKTGLCRGFTLPEIQDYSFSLQTRHRIVEIDYLDEPRSSEQSVFSNKCNLISPPGQCCSSCATLKYEESRKQSKMLSKGNDINAKYCNDRLLTKEQLENQLSRLRKDLKNATEREKNLRETDQISSC